MYALTMLMVAFFWGGSFIAIQAVVHDAPPVASAFWRVVLATVLTFFFNCFHKPPKPSEPYRGLSMISGLLAMGLPWAMLFWAEQHVNGALGAIMNATVPILVVVLNPLFQRGPRVAIQQWFGILTAFAGILIIFVPRVMRGPASDGLAVLGLVGMVLFYSTSINFMHRFLKHVPASRVAVWQGVGAGSLLLLVVFFSGESVIAPVFVQNQTVWMGIAYLGIFSTFIANMIFVKVVLTRGNVAASLVTFLIPIFSMLIEWVWLGTRPTANSLAGLILVLGGLYIVQFYKGKLFSRSKQIDAPIP